MSTNDKVFHNPISGETLVHKTRADGTRDLLFGPSGAHQHGHAVISPNGNPRYIREVDGYVIADDRMQ